MDVLTFVCIRYLHVRLREYAESVAFSRGEKEEQIRADRSLDTLLSAQRKVINRELPLEGNLYAGVSVSYEHFSNTKALLSNQPLSKFTLILAPF
jgi:ABC-type uncharacterized transport system fused permease/ATPase subunit